jgi:ABC-type transport system substrate-binding protein/class 3 adenylate cyclase
VANPAGTPGSPQGGLFTFLIADVRGYTRFTRQRGDEAAGELAARFAALAREGVTAHGGELRELRGDEAMCVFTSARQALRAAVDLQARFRELPLGVGIGLDAGEAVAVEGGYRSGSLNMAARLCAMAGPGEVLASQTVITLAHRVEGVRLGGRRTVRLKGIDEPVTVIQVTAEAELAAPPPPRPSAGRRQGRLVVIAVVLISVIAGAIALGISSFERSPGLRGIEAGAVGVIDPGNGSITAEALVGTRTAAVATGAGAIWVANAEAGSVTRLDEQLRTQATVAVGHDPAGVAVTGRDVWVTNSLDGTVSRISADALPLQVVQTVTVGNGPIGIAAGDGKLWVADSLDSRVTVLDAGAGTVIRHSAAGPDPTAVAVAYGSVWATNESAGTVTRINPSSGAVIGTIPVGSGPDGITAGAGAVWVTNSLDGTVSRIDPQSLDVATTGVGAEPGGPAISGGSLWVALSGAVAEIDTTGPRLVRTVPVGSDPAAVAAAGGRLWVPTAASVTGHRGGTLRGLSTGSIDTLDPAVSYFTQVWRLLALTNDGLVSFKRVGGPGGETLVADLATSLPAPTGAGTVYAFQLRRGIRYSTGAPVRASDIRRGIERTLALGSPGLSYYQGIIGAGRCRPGRCHLAKGISVDDRAGTISFRLTAADPEFLDKLALPFAVAVPPGTPMRDMGLHGVAGTGPYMYAAGGGQNHVVVVRNPHFHVWSADAQPAGLPDRIVWTFDVPAARLAPMVEQGQADWMADTLPPHWAAETAIHHRAQLHPVPALSTFAFVPNAHTRPFDDARARRALNYAIDRRAVVALMGGPAAAVPTCQVLPPDFPGYAPYCPYTAGPSANGSWTAPDMATAMRLVRESGTRGMRVTVATIRAATPLALGRYTVKLLDRLGYRASLVSYPQNGYYGPAQQNQLFLFKWTDDYPAASAFLGPVLGCAAPVNLGGFCDPRVEAAIAQARRVQITDPATANDLWARVDRLAVDDAAWVPMVTPSTTVFLSNRVGNYQDTPQLQNALIDQLWVR